MTKLRGPERTRAADKVSVALLECIHTLTMLDAFQGDPQKGSRRSVPFADNVRRAVEMIEPLRPLLAQLLYDLPEEDAPREDHPVT